MDLLLHFYGLTIVPLGVHYCTLMSSLLHIYGFTIVFVWVYCNFIGSPYHPDGLLLIHKLSKQAIKGNVKDVIMSFCKYFYVLFEIIASKFYLILIIFDRIFHLTSQNNNGNKNFIYHE